jgi:pimeloyl-ACP methyl ester carboxylesterase
MKIILRLSVTLLVLVLAVMIAAWVYFDEENITLNAATRSGFDETFIDLPLGTVHYELGGPANGEVVVLVHGFSVPAYIWDPTFEVLTKAGYRVLRFDLYGRGHSDRPDTDYTIVLFAEQLRQLVEGLELDTPFNLAGLSMGGPVATLYSNLEPHMIKRLILVDPLVFAPSEEDIAPLNIPLVGSYMAGVYLIPQIAAGQSSDFRNKDRFPDWEERFREQMQYHGFRNAIHSTIQNLPSHDTLAEYRKLGQQRFPVQLFWGRHDQTIPLAHSEKVLELVPQAGFDIIEDAGHLPHFEQAEVFNPLLLDFLQQPVNH